MRAFHIDMNGGQYPKEYLHKWIKELQELKYDTIIWEIENGIEWQTCPEAASKDAFSKDDFKEILSYASSLGFDNIPLLQTIGHVEYVLKNPEYQHLMEVIENPRAYTEFSQYCPCKKEVMPFVHAWIEEYFEIFDKSQYFHIGADEAWYLGHCPECTKKAEETSLSQLYIDHINKVVEPILKRNKTPIIWGDMILHHHEALDLLDKRFMIFDWMYSIYRASDKLHVWGKGTKTKEELSQEDLNLFGKYLFPDGDQTKAAETFYTADFLEDKGFKTLTCPSSSSYGDNIFSPRFHLHLNNCFDSIQKGHQSHLEGFIFTSWSVHLFPWELQRIFIAINAFLIEKPNGSHQEYQDWYEEKYFGGKQSDFWESIELVSIPLKGGKTHDIGHSKENLNIDENFMLADFDKMSIKQKNIEFEETREKLIGYQNAYRAFKAIKENTDKNDYEINHWILAAENLIVRAKGALVLLDAKNEKSSDEIQIILDLSHEAEKKTIEMYQDKILPHRGEEFRHYIYDSFHFALRSKQ